MRYVTVCAARKAGEKTREMTLVIVPATGGRGFSRFGAQATLILFEISGIATG